MAPQKDTTDPAGQEPEELDEVEETDDDPEDEPGEEAGGEPEWTPPTREQWDAAQAKLKRAREQARKLRESGRPAAAPAGADPQAAAAAQADVEKWQARAVSTAAKAELLARGADPDMVELALGRLKVSQVEFGDDDQPDLEDWLDEIQDRYPKLFKPAEPAAPAAPARPRPGKVEPGGAKPVRPRMSLGEQIIANSTGLGRRR